MQRKCHLLILRQFSKRTEQFRSPFFSIEHNPRMNEIRRINDYLIVCAKKAGYECKTFFSSFSAQVIGCLRILRAKLTATVIVSAELSGPSTISSNGMIEAG